MLADLDLAYHVWSGSFEDFETAYQQVAEAGIRSIVLTAQRGNLDLRERADLLEAERILKGLGLAAPACHCQDWGPANLTEPDEDLRPTMIQMHSGLMEKVAELGCRTFVLHLGPKPKDGSDQAAWDRIRDAVDKLAPRAEAVGIKLALENGFSGYVATNEQLLSFVADYDCPSVGICYDSGHAHLVDDAAAVLRALSPYVVTVHLHDNDGTSDQHLLPGQGTIQWEPVVEALGACPRLVLLETEAANCTQWPHSRDVCSYREAYARYCKVLGRPMD